MSNLSLPDLVPDPLEEPLDNEVEAMSRIMDGLTVILKGAGGPSNPFRAAHAKAVAIARATFIVPADLPPHLQVGLFAEPGERAAWVRFSNASERRQVDTKMDVRGIAIKVQDRGTEKLIADPGCNDSHDFLLVRGQGLPFGTISDMLEYQLAYNSGQLLRYFASPRVVARLRGTLKAVDRSEDYLGVPFFSIVPYRFGEEAVKYRLEPKQTGNTETLDNPDKYRINIRDALARGEASYDLMVQRRSRPDRQPIEDALVEWTVEDSPPERVATIVLHKQNIEAVGQDELGELMRMNCWHARPEHRPLGGINRVRRVAYFRFGRERLERRGLAPEACDPFEQ